MGLAEKRGVKTFQEGSYKKLTSEINALAGYDIDFDVNWDTLAIDDNVDMYDENFTQIYFQPVINSFKEITSDEMGKEALKDILKKIEIKNVKGAMYGSSAYSIADGVLTIDHLPNTNAHHTDDRTKSLTELLMSKM